MIWLIVPTAIAGLFLWPKKDREGKPSSVGREFFGPFLEGFKFAGLPGSNLYGPPLQTTIDKQALKIAKEKLIVREGRKNAVYRDSLGFPTVGIGHKVTAADNLRVGQVITDAQIDAFFDQDIQIAFAAAKQQAIELKKYTPEFLAALISVNFQLGTGWKYKFENTYEDLKKDNAAQAIRRLQQSAWYSQTPARVSDFISAIQNAYV